MAETAPTIDPRTARPVAAPPTPAEVFERVAGREARERAKVDTAPAWASMRGGHRNTGRMAVAPVFRDDLGIRRFTTGNAVFSTPVVGADETLYVGSADHVVYAFDPIANATRWTRDVGEVIDTAGCIGADGTVYVPTGNGLFAFAPDGATKWHIDLLQQKTHFSPSTIYWWEGNSAVGPNGWVYAGCDDFHVYAIDPQGNVRWRVLTGCCVWTTACFGPDDTVYFVSFDFRLYAFDMHTGRIKWTRNLKNYVVSSPAVGEDGTLYVGSFDRCVYAIDGRTGATKWKTETGGHVYASPAIDDRGSLYVGSADGNVYRMDAATGAVRWAYYTGDAVRSSAALGPDPEGTCPYLVYVGSGTGTLYAFEPDGACRWSYDTLAETSDRPQYCNINAAVALGRHGLATASANGDVLYVPYTVAKTHADSPGFRVRPPEAYPADGAALYPVSVGGVVSTAPVGTVTLHPADTFSLRLVHRSGGHTLPATIDPATLRVDAPDGLDVRSLVSPDGSQVNLVPLAPAAPGAYPVSIRAEYVVDGSRRTIDAGCTLDVRPVDAPARSVEGMAFRVEQMSIYIPSVIPSFDQIAIASLAIDVHVFSHDAATGKVAAWGVQKFGIGPDGEPAAGIPVPRSYFFAFEGTYRDGTLMLESKECQYEITAFPVPLDRLRFTASVTEKGVVASSMLAEVRVRGAVWRTIKAWLPLPRRGGGGRFLYRLRRMFGMFGSWFPEDNPARGFRELWIAAVRMIPNGFWILAARVWRPWGMVDRGGWFLGLGTFLAGTPKLLSHEALRVVDFAYDAKHRRVRAWFRADAGYLRGDACPGIVLVDRATGEPVPLNYSLTLWTKRDRRNVPAHVTLELPSRLDVTKGLDAVLFVDLEKRGRVSC